VFRPQAYVKDASGQGTIQLKKHKVQVQMQIEQGTVKEANRFLGAIWMFYCMKLNQTDLPKVTLQNKAFRETAVTSRVFS
jgi:hypothetical protein